MLGGSGFTLTCCVSGADHLDPFNFYQWTKDNGTQTQIQDGPDPRTISFATLSVSDVGWYTCQATIQSPHLNNSIIRSGSQDIVALSEFHVINRLCIVLWRLWLAVSLSLHVKWRAWCEDIALPAGACGIWNYEVTVTASMHCSY